MSSQQRLSEREGKEEPSTNEKVNQTEKKAEVGNMLRIKHPRQAISDKKFQ